MMMDNSLRFFLVKSQSLCCGILKFLEIKMEMTDYQFSARLNKFELIFFVLLGMATGSGYVASKVNCVHAVWHCCLPCSTLHMASSRSCMDGKHASSATLEPFTSAFQCHCFNFLTTFCRNSLTFLPEF